MIHNPAGRLSGYEIRHLIGHLRNAGRWRSIHSILGLETSDGRNAWYETRNGDQATHYVADIHLALEAAEADILARGAAQMLGVEYRYALILGSLSSQASRVSPALLRTFVERDFWPIEEGMSYARRI